MSEISKTLDDCRDKVRELKLALTEAQAENVALRDNNQAVKASFDERAVELAATLNRAGRYESALRSIAANSCCGSCREAGMVAAKALRESATSPNATYKPHPAQRAFYEQSSDHVLWQGFRSFRIDADAVESATSDPARVQSDEPAQGERLRDSNSSSLMRSSSSLRTLHMQVNVVMRRHGAVLPACDGPDCEICRELAALLSPVEGRPLPPALSELVTCSLRDPDQVVHLPRLDCQHEAPHLISACGAFKSATPMDARFTHLADAYVVAAMGKIAAALTVLVGHEHLHAYLVAAQHLLNGTLQKLDENQRNGIDQDGR